MNRYEDSYERTRRTTANAREENRVRRKGGRGRWFLILLLLLAVGVWFAPAIVLRSGMRNKIVQWAAPDFPGKVIIGSGSAGWLSPIELRDVAIWDAQGQPIARIPVIRSDKQLSAWISNPKQLGGFKIHSPELHLVIDQKSSNLESLLEPFMEKQGSSEAAVASDSTSGVAVAIEILDGKVRIEDRVMNTVSTVENLNMQMSLPESAPAPIHVSLSATAQQDALRGDIAAEFSWVMPAEVTDQDVGDGQLSLKSNGFPLIALQPALRRSESDLYLAGQLESDLICTWRRTDTGPAIEAKGMVAVNNPHMQMPSVLGTDQIRLRVVNANVDVASQDQLININSLRLTSDLANIEMTGAAGLAELLSTTPVASKILDWESSHQLQLRGNVDVAGLARQLPTTIRLRDDTRIDRGQVILDLFSRIELGQRVIQGAVRTERIEGVTAGRQVQWDKPLELSISAASSVDGVMIRELACKSDFLQMTGNGTLDQGQVRAVGDLQELMTQVGQFCDVGDLQLVGRLDAQGGWQRSGDSQYEANLKGTITQFAAAASNIKPIKEENLQLAIATRFSLNQSQVSELAYGQIEIVSGEDRLDARLSNSVPRPSVSTAWPIRLNLTGHTETWIARLQPFIDSTGFDMLAGIEVSTEGTIHPTRINLDPINATLTNVSAKSPGWLIREPKVQLKGSLDWDGTRNTVVTPSLTLTSSAIAARADNINIVIDGDKTSAKGVVAYRGILDRLWDWQYSSEPQTTRAQGEMQGQISFATSDGIISFQSASNVKDLIIQQRSVAPRAVTPNAPMPGWSPAWTEPNLRVVANGTYDPQLDRLDLKSAEANGEGVGLVAGGELEGLMVVPRANLRGEIQYDLARLSTKLQDTLGPSVRLSGTKKSQFVMQGPLSASSISISGQAAPGQPTVVSPNAVASSQFIPLELLGEAGLAWDAIDAYGVSIGPQQITTKLENGTLFFSPLQTAVGGGQVNLNPRIEFNANPMMLVMDQGSLDHIQLTPEMFQTWFKYVAPLLANAATAQGQLSVALQGVRVPLEQPMTSSLAGKVTIHGARVEAGPMAQQVLGVVRELSGMLNRSGPRLDFLNQGEKWMEVNPQEIDFQMQRGYVQHRNLEIKAGKVPIRTSGWVGLNQTIGLTAEIPVQDEWLDGRKLLESLRGQTIKIPIQGDFARPQLDRQSIVQLSRQLIGNTAQQLIQTELQKGLQKLLGPK